LEVWGVLLNSAIAVAKSGANKVVNVATAAQGVAVTVADTAVAMGSEAYGGTVQAGRYVAAGTIVATEEAAAASAKLVAGTVSLAGKIVNPILSPAASVASQIYKKIRYTFSPSKPALIPCISCLVEEDAAARAARIEKRNQLIASVQNTDDPAAKADAKQLKDDMFAVEMARLSADSYNEPPNPPAPWKPMTDEQLRAQGVNPDLLKTSHAVIYRAPDSFPFNPKTVLAFRGTTNASDDILADNDQAMGMKTAQYTAAMKLGKQVGKSMPEAEVTGHSLGGGKAQAAGIEGNLKGIMFNSAGLNPDTVNLTEDQLAQHQDQFIQCRTEGGIAQMGGDPLTGIQNLPPWQQNVLLKTVLGTSVIAKGAASVDSWAREQVGMQPLVDKIPEQNQQLVKDIAGRLDTTPEQLQHNYKVSGGKWYLPPAVGEVRGVISKNEADGTNASIANQHSIVTMTAGYESRKLANVSALLAATNTNDNPEGYIGPTNTVMR
jgi:hypothetical protein